MIVKRCTTDDVERIYQIEEKSFDDPLKKETIMKDLAKDSYYCYALFDGELVSFMSYERVFEEGQIITVATAPEYRKKGYGARLFDEVCKIAKNDGVELFTLEVRSNNTAAVALYESVGFKKVGLRKNYYDNPKSDAILMDLHLTKE